MPAKTDWVEGDGIAVVEAAEEAEGFARLSGEGPQVGKGRVRKGVRYGSGLI